MRFTRTPHGCTLWASAADTSQFARRWPCSILRGRRLRADFDSRGDLTALTVNGRRAPDDLTAAELSALVEQFTGSANPQPSEA